jgi:hypothetical protein
MKNVCTVSDINYLNQGLALYESLLKHSDDFILHYLCIDNKTFEKLKQYECDTLKVYDVEHFLRIDTILNNLQKTEYRYFCWSLASYFSNQMLKSNIDSITYIDSDIYFHKSLDYIFDDIGDKDVGIFRHRQFPLNSNRPEGLYNVGVVYFKNTPLGKKVSAWWVDAVINKKYPQYATCGDQKYLEYFQVMTGNDNIYIDGNIGHGAPWHWQTCQFMGKGKIKYGGQLQDLVFTHFSQFEDKGETYTPSTMHHVYTPLIEYKNNLNLKIIYDEYHKELKHIEKKYYGSK